MLNLLPQTKVSILNAILTVRQSLQCLASVWFISNIVFAKRLASKVEEKFKDCKKYAQEIELLFLRNYSYSYLSSYEEDSTSPLSQWDKVCELNNSNALRRKKLSSDIQYWISQYKGNLIKKLFPKDTKYGISSPSSSSNELQMEAYDLNYDYNYNPSNFTFDNESDVKMDEYDQNYANTCVHESDESSQSNSENVSYV